MICDDCKNGKHCKTPSCTCQHKKTEKLEDGTIAPEGVRRDVR